jgi:hypothetical protein
MVDDVQLLGVIQVYYELATEAAVILIQNRSGCSVIPRSTF